MFQHFCETEGSKEKSHDQEDNIDDSGVAMETVENDIVMETDAHSQGSSAESAKTKKKKKKKKKPKKTDWVVCVIFLFKTNKNMNFMCEFEVLFITRIWNRRWHVFE